MSVRRDLIASSRCWPGSPRLIPIPTPLFRASGRRGVYNGTEESFMDRYGDAIYLTPMVLGALASVFAAAWRFLGVRPDPGKPR